MFIVSLYWFSQKKMENRIGYNGYAHSAMTNEPWAGSACSHKPMTADLFSARIVSKMRNPLNNYVNYKQTGKQK